MKISNIKHIKSFVWADILTNILLLISLIFPHNAYWSFIVLLLIPSLFILILQLKYTEIDNSAGCFTVRKIHPFSKKGFVPPKN